MDDSEKARWVLVYADGDTEIESDPMPMDVVISNAMQAAKTNKTVYLKNVGQEKAS